MRMRGYRIYTTEGEARGRVYSMTPNPNCITGLYQNAEAFPLPIQARTQGFEKGGYILKNLIEFLAC